MLSPLHHDPQPHGAGFLPGQASTPEAAALDLAVRRRLLRSLSSRGSTEAAGVVIPGVLCWFYSRSAPAGPLWVWWAIFVALTLGVLWLRHAFRRDVLLPDNLAVPKWERIFERAALAAGLCWAAPIGLTLQGGTTEFRLFLGLVLCAVIASAATFLAPLPGIFWRFFLAIYLPLLGATYWYFPQHWEYLLPLLLLYGATIARHAWGGRRLVMQQVERERERQQLAEGYRVAKEQAERALQEKSRFISTTSHDLRQPLHAMGLLVETALQRNSDTALAPVLHDVQACVRSLSFMFNALMDLSRLESGAFTARREPVAMRGLFEEAATVFSPDAAQRGLRLRLYLPRRREAWVNADPALLRQMVFNLTQNALRYTRSGGVLLGLRARAGQWRIEVWDTGAGVAPEDQQRIYAPYFRNQPLWAPHADGHGLGLAVVARSAQLMGAGYGVESTPARGSCFWLQLPRADAVKPTGEAEGVAQRTAAGSLAPLSGCCLLVDDDPQAGTALQMWLHSCGLQVTLCATGAQAMAALQDGLVPDVVLCDQRLPAGESGFAVLQALLARCGHARGAMVSGEHADPELLQAQEEGYLVLRKPLEPDVLHTVLTRWLATSSAG